MFLPRDPASLSIDLEGIISPILQTRPSFVSDQMIATAASVVNACQTQTGVATGIIYYMSYFYSTKLFIPLGYMARRHKVLSIKFLFGFTRDSAPAVSLIQLQLIEYFASNRRSTESIYFHAGEINERFVIHFISRHSRIWFVHLRILRKIHRVKM